MNAKSKGAKGVLFGSNTSAECNGLELRVRRWGWRMPVTDAGGVKHGECGMRRPRGDVLALRAGAGAARYRGVGKKEKIWEMCWRCKLSRVSFPPRSTEGPLFPVVSGLPRLFGVGCRGIALRCGVRGRGDWCSDSLRFPRVAPAVCANARVTPRAGRSDRFWKSLDLPASCPSRSLRLACATLS